jgi:hypothetical protein
VSALKDEADIANSPRHVRQRTQVKDGRQQLTANGLVNSFVKAKHVLDGIHDGRFVVSEAI